MCVYVCYNWTIDGDVMDFVYGKKNDNKTKK